MKAIILTEGGFRGGFGQITRSLALYQGLRKKDINVELIIDGDRTVKDLVMNSNHRIFHWLKKQKEAFSIIKEADIVIIDSYLAPFKFYKRLSCLIKRPVYVDDNNYRFDYPEGIVVNGNHHAGLLNYNKNQKAHYLLGPLYTIIRQPFWRVPNKIIRRNVRDVLITLGGTELTVFLKKLMNFLLSQSFDFTYHIVAAPPDLHRIHLPKCQLYPRLSALKMRNLMMRCDICISGGGQTLYELARVGIPTIGICVIDNQELHLKVCSKEGFVDYVGWLDDKAILTKVSRSTHRLLSYEKRAAYSKAGRSYVNGKGVKNIINEVISYGTEK